MARDVVLVVFSFILGLTLGQLSWNHETLGGRLESWATAQLSPGKAQVGLWLKEAGLAGWVSEPVTAPSIPTPRPPLTPKVSRATAEKATSAAAKPAAHLDGQASENTALDDEGLSPSDKEALRRLLQ